MRRTALLFVTLGLLIGSRVSATTLTVPGDFATIQGAIVAAVDGDVIVVSSGTYAENINFLGKAITVQSVSGPSTTIVDAGGSGSVVTFQAGEMSDTVLSGFTITNGQAADGGGILCTGTGSPTILDCRVVANIAGDDGGGIYSIGGSPTIAGCEISDNTCGDDGGGLLCSGGAPMIVDCLFSDNAAMGSPTPNGGGIHTRDGSSPLITRCVIRGNFAEEGAGGIRCFNSDATITDCLIIGNSSGTNGGGVRAYDSSPILTNCTIHGNSAITSAGGLESESSSSTVLVNSIVWGNGAPTSPQLLAGGAGSLSVTYSDVAGGWPGVGNLDLDPEFVDAIGPDGSPATGDENFRLTASSPCVDAGSNVAPALPALDFEGDERVVDGDADGVAVVDMGADEVAGGFLRGDVNSDGVLDVSDAVFGLAALFIPGSSAPTCDDASDANDDGLFDISDAVYTLAALFIPGSSPTPAPGGQTCGPDPTADGLDCAGPTTCP
ncbi:MAG: right-handed parallel beta-helix repeat-containing protein [Planctomycetes bacterium]|nr:right-handed parallel beta-helix repeat-containing protein [Planctomycetota bacterium]